MSAGVVRESECPLSLSEQARREELETLIQRGLDTFHAVGAALLEIRDARLYRREFATFEEYCRGRWGLKERRAYQMMDAAQVVSALQSCTMVQPLTAERQARELVPLKDQPEEQRAAWQEATVRAQETGRPVTAAIVREVVAERRADAPASSAPEGLRSRPVLPPPTAPSLFPAPAPEPVDEFAGWSDDERARWAALESGQTVVVNLRDHPRMIDWADAAGLFVRCDRRSDWGNPFLMGPDGDRNAVCRAYAEFYLPHKPSLLARLHELKGKALGCWCAPDRCHCDTLRAMADDLP